MNFNGMAQGYLNYDAQQKEDAKQQQEQAFKGQLMQMQALQLENSRADQVRQQRNATMQGWDQPMAQPAPQPPPPGQASVPMVQNGAAPNQAPSAPSPQLYAPQPGGGPGVGMMQGGGAPNAPQGAPQPGGGPPAPPSMPIPRYQSMANMQAPAPAMPQQGQMTPPPLPAQETPEQASQKASADVMKLASGPDAYTQLIQNVMAHGAAQGQQLTSSRPKGRGFLRRYAMICESLRRAPASLSGLIAPTLHRLRRDILALKH